jgi:3-oxo-5-alpha-steroid 4-dehydrogenase 3 / polyprenol reductase
LLDHLFGYPVPHSWFLHYYIVSISLSLFWGYQLFTRGSIILWVASQTSQDVQNSMSLERVYLAWALLTFQGCRRFHETVAYNKSSQSTMPLSIYLIGVIYYLFDSVGVWIEGSATILNAKPLTWMELFNKVAHSAPSFRTILCLPLFMIASGIQNDCHRYLASLPKYTLPDHPIFHRMVCPHYFMECLIYLSLSLLAAPKGQILNKTIFTTLLFTTVNLGLVAKGAKDWSIKKFGREKVEPRWRMIPGLW